MKATLVCGLIMSLLIGALPANAEAIDTGLTLQIDQTQWQYNAEDDVYWQVGIPYCATPADRALETLGIFVPAAYMDASDNGDGTYTCTIHPNGTVAGYTALDAPMVIPVNTPGYSSMAAPTGYISGVRSYTDAGFIYVSAGCRGRDQGAPTGITDLKAAVRFLRHFADSIPGSTDRIFTFGMSGGGAQSALMGATGDSQLYLPYLEAIGAIMDESDAVAGSMCWCPITSLDLANEAYEWNMGSTRSNLDADTQALSDALSAAFVTHINALGLTDADGTILTLDESGTSGSYYDAVKALIERSLNHFLEDTTFPYSTSSGMDGMMGMMRMGEGNRLGGRMINDDVPQTKRTELPDGELPDDKLPERDSLPSINAEMGEAPSFDGNDLPSDVDWANGNVDDGITRTVGQTSMTSSATYETAADYINALNGDNPWIVYDADTNTATITSVEAFVNACKTAAKSVGAFDDLNRSQGENTLFGIGDGQGLHFDPIMAEALAGTEKGDEYTQDLTVVDSLGTDMQTRMNMYNPMYYLCDAYDGYRSATVATYWRIRSGIEQGDTALTTEMNLALALESYGANVDFETIWEQAHTQAERTGDSTSNLIAWINSCLQ